MHGGRPPECRENTVQRSLTLGELGPVKELLDRMASEHSRQAVSRI